MKPRATTPSSETSSSQELQSHPARPILGDLDSTKAFLENRYRNLGGSTTPTSTSTGGGAQPATMATAADKPPLPSSAAAHRARRVGNAEAASVLIHRRSGHTPTPSQHVIPPTGDPAGPSGDPSDEVRSHDDLSESVSDVGTTTQQRVQPTPPAIDQPSGAANQLPSPRLHPAHVYPSPNLGPRGVPASAMPSLAPGALGKTAPSVGVAPDAQPGGSSAHLRVDHFDDGAAENYGTAPSPRPSGMGSVIPSPMPSPAVGTMAVAGGGGAPRQVLPGPALGAIPSAANPALPLDGTPSSTFPAFQVGVPYAAPYEAAVAKLKEELNDFVKEVVGRRIRDLENALKAQMKQIEPLVQANKQLLREVEHEKKLRKKIQDEIKALKASPGFSSHGTQRESWGITLLSYFIIGVSSVLAVLSVPWSYVSPYVSWCRRESPRPTEGSVNRGSGEMLSKLGSRNEISAGVGIPSTPSGVLAPPATPTPLLGHARVSSISSSPSRRPSGDLSTMDRDGEPEDRHTRERERDRARTPRVRERDDRPRDDPEPPRPSLRRNRVQ